LDAKGKRHKGGIHTTKQQWAASILLFRAGTSEQLPTPGSFPRSAVARQRERKPTHPA